MSSASRVSKGLIAGACECVRTWRGGGMEAVGASAEGTGRPRTRGGGRGGNYGRTALLGGAKSGCDFICDRRDTKFVMLLKILCLLDICSMCQGQGNGFLAPLCCLLDLHGHPV